MSFLFRPVRQSDLPAIHNLLQERHTGFTHVPETPQQLEDFVQTSIKSFGKKIEVPGPEIYVFVLEDCSSKEIVGISEIRATTGHTAPLFFYKIQQLESQSKHLHIPKSIPVLQPISYIRGPSEIAALFLSQKMRGKGLGRLLSLARFLFIAQERRRVTDTLYTELRGVIHDDGTSPFWTGIGSKFYNLSFQEALQVLISEGRSIVSQFLPHYPIYIDLLPKEVQEVIGKTHVETDAARFLLTSEGFVPTGEIDVFDGGPKLSVETNKVQSIVESRILPLDEKPLQGEGKLFLIANCSLDFKATIAPIALSDKTIQLSSETKELVDLKPNDKVRFTPLARKS